MAAVASTVGKESVNEVRRKWKSSVSRFCIIYGFDREQSPALHSGFVRSLHTVYYCLLSLALCWSLESLGRVKLPPIYTSHLLTDHLLRNPLLRDLNCAAASQNIAAFRRLFRKVIARN